MKRELLDVYEATKKFCVDQTWSPLPDGSFSKMLRLSDAEVGKVVLDGDARSEAEILRQMDHPGIVKCLEVLPFGNRVMIVQPYGGQDLFNLALSLGDVRPLILQIADAVQYVHSLHIVHRDIKLENVVYDGTRIKLIDFGLSHVFPRTQSDGLLRSKVGTKAYMPPETFVVSKAFDAYKVDVWATGVVFFSLVAKVFPFDNASPRSTHYSRIRDHIAANDCDILDAIGATFGTSRTYSPRMRLVLSSMLEHDPDRRASMKDIFKILSSAE